MEMEVESNLKISLGHKSETLSQRTTGNTFYKCSLEHARKCVVGVATKQNGTPLVSHFPLVFIFSCISKRKKKINLLARFLCQLEAS